MSPPTSPARLLVVDDEPDLRALYELSLQHEGHSVETAADLEGARRLLARQTFDCVITDMRLPDGSGLELVTELSQAQRPERMVVITAYGSAQNAVEALKAGAFDYLTKPVDLQHFRGAVAAALRARTDASDLGGQGTSPSQATRVKARAEPHAEASTDASAPSATGAQALARIVGQSDIMAQVRQRIARVARSMAPVLIQGESGTGKELAARALHACSHRQDGPFVAVNCGAIPETLLEAEFFGVRKGAYTGATHDRPGYFQAARGGTLFLDEIGDLPLLMQAKLLRAIQERCVRPLGSSQEEAIDVRFVSATHRDLAQAVQAAQFRQDLYYRLNVIEIRMPALRERPDDLQPLAWTLLQRLCAEGGQPVPEISEEAMHWLRQRPLPGNVRELENLLHRGLALCEHGRLEVADLHEPGAPQAQNPNPTPTPAVPASVPAPAPTRDPAERAAELIHYLDATERRVLQEALSACGGDVDAAAARLGLTPTQLGFRLRRLDIRPAAASAGHDD